jgi:alcohol dehydrogenase
MTPFTFQTRTRIVYGEGALDQLPDLARELAFHRTLLVADRGLLAAGYVDRAATLLRRANIDPIPFHDFSPNPDSAMIDAGRAFAEAHAIDSLIGLGGGSSLDCAKAINFVLSNGGVIEDYWGWAKAARPMLPMIGIPTTAGTGSEAQSYALISDATTHAKMACGDPKAAFRAAILDPALIATQPAEVKAAAGYDAISHAIEAYVTTKRTPLSALFAREAWRLLDANFEPSLDPRAPIDTLGAMLLGAHLAGIAIENSMLGATHACANPLTANYGTTHGIAIAALLPHVVRWNHSAAAALYDDLAPQLADRLEQLARAAALPRGLRTLTPADPDLAKLSEEAAAQWTGKFNPRPFDASGALEIYRCAL